MYFVCRVVIPNYFGWVMLQAVSAEENPSVSPLQCPHVAPYEPPTPVLSAAIVILHVGNLELGPVTLHVPPLHMIFGMQVWDWGGIALYSMLSILNAMWFAQICSMIVRGMQKRKSATRGLPYDDRATQKHSNSDQEPQKLVTRDSIKGTPDVLRMRQRKHANKIAAVH